ncbi:hypothetical protein QIS99_28845 [Streptomyces sp. B-S-A8]|uniref:Uncharacterized protein n=1 Tax=Streptomyces solicavernae TaxID=3043614 RepID=A0ABT6S0E4_9ACTN|nr:hypothetical protein [Streptomyces sp. B-S-A8]MDI3390169.1 hypothetical protein [Streptomyces sp. B-S-A8]
MQMHSDDELYAVDSVFLGPPRFTLPFKARYQAYAVGITLTIALLILLKIINLMAFWPIAYGMVAVIWATRKITPHITHDSSLTTLVRTVWNDVRAPRSASQQQETVTEMTSTGIRRHTYL